MISKTMLYNSYGLSGAPENVIISEGITKIKVDDSGYGTIRFDSGVGGGGGKLVLPKSLTTLESGAFAHVNFSRVEINSENLTTEINSILFNSNTSPTIIMSANANINFDEKTFYWDWAREYRLPSGVNIACKGKPDDCLAKFGNSLDHMSGAINANYYEERDSDNNLLLKYHDNGYYKYDSKGNIAERWNLDSTEQYDAKGNVIAKYDLNGTMRYAKDENGLDYYFDSHGNLSKTTKRGPFTISEANALTKDGPVNTVTITW